MSIGNTFPPMHRDRSNFVPDSLRLSIGKESFLICSSHLSPHSAPARKPPDMDQMAPEEERRKHGILRGPKPKNHQTCEVF
ncbi:hypothetical protein PENSUB_210 [Penicillium subrubescens]|uniref:Uncharacterized protein n=1 Tax=Penicillium subrubescens TaxID=1316194 RepID=A0A1Q5UNR9_9EURO|nr:hypothetical protein PENSUB_210 [Penicillium subrubescens]